MTDSGFGLAAEVNERLKRHLLGGSKEEMELEARLRNLEMERRNAASAIEREEKEMRANLERLRNEKSSNEGSPNTMEKIKADNDRTKTGI